MLGPSAIPAIAPGGREPFGPGGCDGFDVVEVVDEVELVVVDEDEEVEDEVVKDEVVEDEL